MTEKRTYSTLEISRMCEVDPVTVARWCDQGQLKCYRTPGGHRRVLREDVRQFLRQHGVPIPKDLEDALPRVLIVDDDPAFVRGMKSALREARGAFQVSFAADGVDALLRIGSEIPDVVILDLLLPRMDGVEVCGRIRANPKTAGIVIIGVTASSDKRLAAAVLKAGAQTCLVKPVRWPDLEPHLLKAGLLAGDGRRIGRLAAPRA